MSEALVSEIAEALNIPTEFRSYQSEVFRKEKFKEETFYRLVV